MNTQKVQMNEPQLNAWIELVSGGISKAISGLSQMVGQEIDTASIETRQIPIKDAPDLLGGAETPTAAVYLSVNGIARGHVVLIFQPKTAFEIIDMVMGEPPGSTQSLGEMEESALGEVGNIMGSFFLNHLADSVGIDLRISPPAVMMDMAGAILDVVLAEILMESDDALVVEALFGTKDRRVNGTFLVMPSADLQRSLLGRVAAS